MAQQMDLSSKNGSLPRVLRCHTALVVFLPPWQMIIGLLCSLLLGSTWSYQGIPGFLLVYVLCSIYLAITTGEKPLKFFHGLK